MEVYIHIMSVLTVGGDLRYAWMTRLALEQSIDIKAVGLENAPFPLPRSSWNALSHAEAVVLPNPWRSGLQLPFAGNAPPVPSDLLSLIPDSTPILLSDAASMPESVRGKTIINLSSDEEYILKNAHLTAEGAIISAASLSQSALDGSPCLIIGYGRIGRRLAYLLYCMGADVSIAVRRSAAADEVRRDGFQAHILGGLAQLLPAMRFIFNTAPAQVLSETHLRRISPDTVLMDLASPPYGFDLDLARSLSVHAVRENGLPGRYCPHSAGACLLDAVLRALTSYRKGANQSCR